MKRRQALLGVLGLGIWLPGASAQPAVKGPVIGLLDAGDRLEWWAAFKRQLGELGYVEGRNVAFELRYASGKFDQLPAFAQELVRLKVSVIVTSGSVTAQIAKHSTSTIPIVMATGEDPVHMGIAASLARPGGNVTGVTSISAGLSGKRLEILREVLPKLSRLAVLWHRDNPASEFVVRELEKAVPSSKPSLQYLPIGNADEFAGAFAAMTKEHAGAAFVVHSPLVYTERRQLAELALKHHLPTIHGASEYVEAGGLLSYGPSYPELFRRAAVYTDKILKGAKPGDLPIEQPTKFELAINVKTAKTLRITIPKIVLLRADQLVQ